MTRGQGNSRLLSTIAATVALGTIVAVLVDSVFRAPGGAEVAILTRLKEFEAEALRIPLGMGTLVSTKVSYQRISVVIDADGNGALVTSTLDFTGAIDRGTAVPTQVSSLGLEKARYRRDGSAWKPETTDAPRLSAILTALESRRVSIEKGEARSAEDGGVIYDEVQRPRVFRTEAWFIRSEREAVEVAEDSRLIGTTLERPIDERRTTRLSLQEDTAGLFSFPGGIL